ncbi:MULTISPECIES: NADH-quinone oxidoreductase subunit A [Anaerolinea]|jgi:NADH:ubiquinone oxidoreductase subunit 3 (subunit A)|uniref:NADH-quinone oxidoreductase subunit A n=1 Tax=Anaerolinea TaxID=233189 RepID=UPI00263601C6|nr:NADH-quinone oxidoreductase subunit A [Anaerolinea thermophila]
MLTAWLYVGIFLVVAVLLPAVAIALAGILAPKKSNPIKTSVYECGIEVVGPARVQIKAQYYIYAMVFLVFDVEMVLLFPWAVAFKQLPLFAVFEGILFLLILLGGLFYAWRKGALEWF